MARTDLYWITQGDGGETGPLTFRQVQSMCHAGTVKVTDKIRRADKSEWHSVNEVRRHLEKGGEQLTVGKIVLAFLILGLVWWCSAVVLH